MTFTTLLLISLAGGAGAVARFQLEGLITRWRPNRPTPGIVLINLSGAAILAPAGAILPPGDVNTMIAIGFLGAFTTFSTWMVQLAGALTVRSLPRILLQLSPALLGPLAYLLGRSISSAVGPH